ncbi:MAG: ABC transporter substrate-binding protein [Phycisphaerales bacterium]|nr:ABC transporter substrate-binding protein [Phycisphaerales bacterium]
MSAPRITTSPPINPPDSKPRLRVVSLLPSATEALCAIGGQSLLVGRSHECDFPASVAHLPVLTRPRIHDDGSPTAAASIDAHVREAMSQQRSLYELDEALLRELRPDVILTQDLCKVCSIDLASVSRVAMSLSRPARIVSLSPETFEGVLDSLLTVGEAVGLADEAAARVTALREEIYTTTDFTAHFTDGPNVSFLEWTDPLFIGGHWTPQLIERAGGRHPLNATRPLREAGAAAGPIGTSLRIAGKSIRIPTEVLVASQPEVIIICPCGLPLDRAIAEGKRLQQHAWFRDLPASKAGRVICVDGNQHFNRPGPRLVEAFKFLVGYLNDRPELIPAGFPWVTLDQAPPIARA